MKKRWIIALILLLWAVALTGCGSAADAQPPVETAPSAAETAAPSDFPAPEVPSPSPEPTPAETAAPVPTEEPGLPLELSAQEQYEANIFLSNFSEQGFGLGRFAGFDRSDADDAQLYAFAHLWAKINRHDAIFYKDSFETMTLESVNEILGRFFGLGIQPADGTDYSAALGMGRFDWDHSWYEDGLFYYPAADGESYTGFTVVDTAESLSGSRTRFRFTVYELDLDIYYDNLGIPQEYYRLTPAEAVQRMTAGEITPRYTGTAVCEPCYLMSSGRESYQLVSYAPDPLP